LPPRFNLLQPQQVQARVIHLALVVDLQAVEAEEVGKYDKMSLKWV